MRFTFLRLLLSMLVLQLHWQIVDGQPKIYCDGLPLAHVHAFVTLHGSIQKGSTKRSKLIQGDLRVHLTDTTFNVIGFAAGYDCHSRSVFDFNSREYLGNYIKPGDPFIQGVEIGDLFVIDCINIEKAGRRYLIRGLQLKVN